MVTIKGTINSFLLIDLSILFEEKLDFQVLYSEFFWREIVIYLRVHYACMQAHLILISVFNYQCCTWKLKTIIFK